MASSVSGQDESNPALWLATRAGKMELSCPLGTTRHVLQEKFPRKPYNKSFIDQACSVKIAEYCPRSFFAWFWTSTPSRSINRQKTNLANIQPSWPHTWSITHTYLCQGWMSLFSLQKASGFWLLGGLFIRHKARRLATDFVVYAQYYWCSKEHLPGTLWNKSWSRQLRVSSSHTFWLQLSLGSKSQ